jgi:hypothetical protein
MTQRSAFISLMKYITLLKIVKHLAVPAGSFRTFSAQSLYAFQDGV